FVPMLEASGLIRPVGEWVLRQACARAREWRAATGRPIRVAANVSPVQMSAGGFEDVARQVLADTGCEAGWIELEITEGALIRDFENMRGRLARLSEMGF